MTDDVALVWFRRDLRGHDHAALYHALKAARRVYCAFVFDRGILDPLPDRADRRVDFIWRSLAELDRVLADCGRQAGGPGGGLMLCHGDPVAEIPRLAAEIGAARVFVNRDYEPVAKARDAAVADALRRQGIGFESFKDQVIFDGDEILTRGGEPFSVFTPYRHAWLRRLTLYHVQAYATETYAAALVPPRTRAFPRLADIGFAASDLDRLGVVAGTAGAHRRLKEFLGRIDDYGNDRDFPARDAPSRLSVHLRFGTLSIREVAGIARQLWEHEFSVGAGVWLNELIWRDFYSMVLDHRPDVVRACFRPQFDDIVWDEWEAGLIAWRSGCTGYPLVDAAMRQLRQTGYMHNRLRMLVASFLTKDLGIDWRHGERHFADHLIDYDLAANNGGWQWAASTGCDAQPYFRIFNPLQQSIKFDPAGDFIRRYCPELGALSAKAIHAPWLLSAGAQRAAGLRIGTDYPAPIVDHGAARQRTLDRFKAVRAA